MDFEDEVVSLENEVSDEEEERDIEEVSKPQGKGRGHKEQLERLKEKDPEFYQYLTEHDKKLLDFSDEDIDEDVDTDSEYAERGADDRTEERDTYKETKPSTNIITTAMVDSWCNEIRTNKKLSAVSSLMAAFRTACHFGDDAGDEPSTKFRIMSSSVFNKIMIFVLTEMDGILRGILNLPPHGGKKETIKDLMTTKRWQKYNHFAKSYLKNSLTVLNQMTDTQMISFTLRCLKYSTMFLAAYPALLRKYIKVALHYWGTGGGALPVVSFLFLRDLCIRLGTDCIDECFKGIYKAYVLNCQYINATKLQHLQFLGNCVIELFGVDIPTAYQHAFVFIRQMAMILREALSMKTKEAFRSVYNWKFINCLELWTGAVCAYNSEADFQPLAYPLVQIISGVAHLVPSARYFPLILRCIKMLNRIAAATGMFIPVSMPLLDMLDKKELHRPPAGGAGKAIDLRTVISVSKQIVKTRAFQEACVISVIEELAEHLAQWSYSIAFLELSFIPATRLRSFCKTTKAERFRKETRQFIRQIEANSQFINAKRMSVSLQPNDPIASTFLEDEKKSGASPLSQYVKTLRQRAQQRTDSLTESSVLVGENSAVFGKKIDESDDDDDDDTKNDEGVAVFSSTWLPGSETKATESKEKKKKKKTGKNEEGSSDEDDVVEDYIFSSEEDEDGDEGEDGFQNDEQQSAGKKKKKKKKRGKSAPTKQKSEQWKSFKNKPKDSVKTSAKKSKKRKRAN